MTMKYVLTSAGCFVLSATLLYYAVNQLSCNISPYTICSFFLLGLLATLTCFLGVAYLFISTQPVSQLLSIPEAFPHFVLEYGSIRYGNGLRAKLESSFKRPRETQEDVLKKILRKNRGTSYYRDFGLSEVNSLIDLKEKHNLTEYDHYLKYVERTAKGEKNVMVRGLPERLILTSGTTGGGKLFPCKTVADRFASHLVHHSTQRKCFPKWQPMRPKLFIYCRPTIRKSAGGTDIAPIGFMTDDQIRFMVNYTTPRIGFKINTLFEAIYVHLLFGLRDPSVGAILSVFTTMFWEAMQLLEKEWPRILRDLSTGSIDGDLKLLPEVRASLTKYLGRGCPERAAELEVEFRKGFDGIVNRIWPNVAFIAAVDILNMRETLQSTYCKGIPIHAHSYAGSEGTYGTNFDPWATSVEFTMFIEEAVFEFIPEEHMMEKQPQTFFLDEVELHKRYELVITQESGLYRYRIGDVVRVTGFQDNCPKVEFLYRTGTVLNMWGEKLSSDIVRSAIRDAVSTIHPEVQLLFYTVAESSLIAGKQIEGWSEAESPGAHYIFFLEIECPDNTCVLDTIDKSTLAKTIDDNLYERHAFYRNFKDTKQIHQSSIYLVHPGSFYKLKDYIIANTSATEIQFKMPDKLRTLEMFRVLFQNRK